MTQEQETQNEKEPWHARLWPVLPLLCLAGFVYIPFYEMGSWGNYPNKRAVMQAIKNELAIIPPPRGAQAVGPVGEWSKAHFARVIQPYAASGTKQQVNEYYGQALYVAGWVVLGKGPYFCKGDFYAQVVLPESGTEVGGVTHYSLIVGYGSVNTRGCRS
jgi:hypothetical protein